MRCQIITALLGSICLAIALLVWCSHYYMHLHVRFLQMSAVYGIAGTTLLLLCALFAWLR
jgi:hypothetical protein